MKTVTLSYPGGSYPIYIGSGLLHEAGHLLHGLMPQHRAIIISDNATAPLYEEMLGLSLEAAGISHESIMLPAGEQTKSLLHFSELLEKILAKNPERRTSLIALGGGVIGDITGFAASVLLRGIPFVQIPTTLLAQVDSSIGGKTAVNSRFGKNLIGSFYQPNAVIADIGTLESLPKRELLSGYAEALKYGLIGDEAFFSWLETFGMMAMADDTEALISIVEASCHAKAVIVSEDEREKGRRALLNLGHTFGHALEKESGFGNLLLHGEAVAIGMLMALRLSVRRGLCNAEEETRVREHYRMVGLPEQLPDIGKPWDAAILARHCLQDKKVENGHLRFILLRGIGHAFVEYDVTPEEAQSVFAEFIF